MIAALGGSVEEDAGASSASPQQNPMPTSLRHSTHDGAISPREQHNSLLNHLDCHQPAYSPLEILAAAVATQRRTSSPIDPSSSDSRQRTSWRSSALSPSSHSHERSPETLAADKMIELYFSKPYRYDLPIELSLIEKMQPLVL